MEFHNEFLFQGQAQANSIKAFGRVERKIPRPSLLVRGRGDRDISGLGMLGRLGSG